MIGINEKKEFNSDDLITAIMDGRSDFRNVSLVGEFCDIDFFRIIRTVCEEKEEREDYIGQLFVYNPQIPMPKLDFSGSDLSKAKFSKVSFYNCNFYNCNFVGTNIDCCSFGNSSLRDAIFDEQNIKVLSENNRTKVLLLQSNIYYNKSIGEIRVNNVSRLNSQRAENKSTGVHIYL